MDHQRRTVPQWYWFAAPTLALSLARETFET
jgi:hypothetical protein